MEHKAEIHKLEDDHCQ